MASRGTPFFKPPEKCPKRAFGVPPLGGTIQWNETLALTPALSPGRGRVLPAVGKGSLLGGTACRGPWYQGRQHAVPPPGRGRNEFPLLPSPLRFDAIPASHRAVAQRRRVGERERVRAVHLLNCMDWAKGGTPNQGGPSSTPFRTTAEPAQSFRSVKAVPVAGIPPFQPRAGTGFHVTVGKQQIH